MAITERQREQRKAHLGASDAPAVIVDREGQPLSPFATPADVYWSKVGELEDDTPTEAMETGNRLEAALIQYAGDQLGIEPNLANRYRVSRNGDEGVLACNVDAWIKGRPEAIEAKYVGPTFAEQWGDGDDHCPDHVIVQAQHQMYVAELERVHVAAFVVSFRPDWRLYRVERDENLINLIVDQELAFWHDHVMPRVPPENMTPSLEIVKRIRREPGKVLETFDVDLVARWEQARQERLDAEKREKQAQAEVLAELGDAEAARLDGGRELTYLEQRSAPKCDTKTLKAEFPEAYQQCVTQGTHRVLRTRKARG